MSYLVGFFAIIGVIFCLFWLLGTLNVIDFSVRVGEVGMNKVISDAVARFEKGE